jgi:hypothetical protein
MHAGRAPSEVAAAAHLCMTLMLLIMATSPRCRRMPSFRASLFAISLKTSIASFCRGDSLPASSG